METAPLVLSSAEERVGVNRGVRRTTPAPFPRRTATENTSPRGLEAGKGTKAVDAVGFVVVA